MWEQAEKPIKNLDDFLGLKDEESPLGDLGSKGPRDVLPEKVANSRILRVLNRWVGIGAGGVAFVALVFGNGTLSAVFSAFAASGKNSTTFDQYLTFGQAFWLTFPFSISVTVFACMAVLGQMKTYAAVTAWCASTVFLTYICGQLGIDGPTVDQLEVGMDHGSSPPAQAVGLVLAFASYYGVIPFLGGLITGGASAGIICEVNDPDFLKKL